MWTGFKQGNVRPGNAEPLLGRKESNQFSYHNFWTVEPFLQQLLKSGYAQGKIKKERF